MRWMSAGEGRPTVRADCMKNTVEVFLRVVIALIVGNISSYVFIGLGSIIAMSIFGPESSSWVIGTLSSVLSLILPCFLAGSIVGLVVGEPTIGSGTLAVAWILFFTISNLGNELLLISVVVISASAGSLAGGAIGKIVSDGKS